MPPIVVRPLVLDDKQEEELLQYVDRVLREAVGVHNSYEERLARFKRAYKAIPEVDKKTFPWDGASNVVVPHAGTAVDAVVAKMMGAIFGAKDFAEVTIHNKAWEPLEKQIRVWINMFAQTDAARKSIRNIFHDAAHDGDAYVEPRWSEETRPWHSYDQAGQVVEQKVITYIGVRFETIPADCVLIPQGYDDWEKLPWQATRHEYTWDQLLDFERKLELEDVERVKRLAKKRTDPRYAVVQKAQGAEGGIEDTYTVFQLRGRFPIPVEGRDDSVFEEVILTYSLDARCFLRKIYNPYFGKFRQLVKVPFLVQPHEVRSMGIIEQVLQFQDLASTAINQVVDAATAANAGLLVTDPESSLAKDPEIHPGKIIVTESPDKTKVVHLSEPSSALQMVVEIAGRMNQVRSGVSDYNLGLESGVVGSRATATGTTALIGQGNLRFNVSIEDARSCIQELFYLTIQQEQQFRPEGTPLPDGTLLVWPKDDPRLAMGLAIHLTSEQINRELEIQSFQILFTILNEYYSRFMQAVALIMNPGFPPMMKVAAVAVINASMSIVKRMVERFDIENIDDVVPSIMQAMEAMMSVGGLGGSPAMGGPPAGGAAALPPASGGTEGGADSRPGSGGQENRRPPATGRSEISY